MDDDVLPLAADVYASVVLTFIERSAAKALSEKELAVIDRARELGVQMIVLKYFDGNDASRRVSEKLGFAWRSREEDVEYPLIGKRLTVHRTELVLAGR